MLHGCGSLSGEENDGTSTNKEISAQQWGIFGGYSNFPFGSEVDAELMAELRKTIPSTINTAPIFDQTSSQKIIPTEILSLVSWTLAIVPNNPAITRIEHSKCKKWVVIVGKRSDVEEVEAIIDSCHLLFLDVAQLSDCRKNFTKRG